LKIPGGRSIAFDVSWTRRTQLAGRGRRRDCRPGTPPRDRAGFFRAIGSAVLEVLDSALVPLGRRPRREGAEGSPPSRARVLLARVESVLSRGELPDHRGASAPVTCKRAAGDPASVARARALAGGVLLGGLLAAAVPAAPATDPPATAAGVLASL